MGRLPKSTAALGAAALLIAGGGAYALASSSGNRITVCVKHHGGTLYKARKCAKHDRKLSWNVQGPTGPKGDTGSPGSPGSPGQQGGPGPTASSFASVNAGTGIALSPAGTNVQVMSLSDGTGAITTSFDGRILLNASLFLGNNTAGGEAAFCRLEIAPAGGSFTQVGQTMATDIGAGEVHAALPLTAAVDEPAGSYNARVMCVRNGPDPGINFFKGDLTAIAAAG